MSDWKKAYKPMSKTELRALTKGLVVGTSLRVVVAKAKTARRPRLGKVPKMTLCRTGITREMF